MHCLIADLSCTRCEHMYLSPNAVKITAGHASSMSIVRSLIGLKGCHVAGWMYSARVAVSLGVKRLHRALPNACHGHCLHAPSTRSPVLVFKLPSDAETMTLTPFGLSTPPGPSWSPLSRRCVTARAARMGRPRCTAPQATRTLRRSSSMAPT